ncbi:MAG: S41 family peptidase [Acidobacteriaceae bacterium]
MKKTAVYILLLLILLTGAGPLLGQIPSVGVDDFVTPPDPHWAGITSSDVEAAYRFLLDNHPGAAPSLHDAKFMQRLTAARDAAMQRAHTVSSYQGYIFTLAAFATSMGDKHIWSRPIFNVAYPRWTGMIVSKRGAAFVVTDTDESHAHWQGAELLSCDGIAAGELARKNLGGFRADWSVGAQEIQAAPWLLVDEQNPFIPRPTTCTFKAGSVQHAVKLDWQRIKREALLPRLKAAIGAGAAGFGVRSVGHGTWIALQDLSAPETQGVVQAVESQKQALRNAAFVVVDVRGNGGGSSEVAREIEESLMGRDFVVSRLGVESQSNCGGADGAWRTSAGNIADMEYLLTTVLSGGSEARRIFSEVLRDAKAARARGEDFSASIHCPVAPRPVVSNPPISALRGKLFLLTDNLCFSSCLALTDSFRELGATQIGQTTDAATHFTEVRETYLPSGYSLFSTLQSVVDAGGPVQVGPFQPSIEYTGDIADTAKLEQWVIRLALQAQTSSGTEGAK